MSESADQRSHVERGDSDRVSPEDAREEYTAYRETDPDEPEKGKAVREADLQPGSPEPPGEKE